MGQWLRIVTGLLEIAGAIMLLCPGSAAFGAGWLGLMTPCATVTRIGILNTDPVPAVFLFLLTAIVLWLRLDRTEEPQPHFL